MVKPALGLPVHCTAEDVWASPCVHEPAHASVFDAAGETHQQVGCEDSHKCLCLAVAEAAMWATRTIFPFAGFAHPYQLAPSPWLVLHYQLKHAFRPGL
jgi:hypothetical protein